MKKLYILFILILISWASAQDNFHAFEQDYKKKKDYKFFRDIRTSIKDPFSLRDPFKRPLSKRAKKRRKLGTPTIEEKVSFLKTISLDDLKIVGILWGTERRAIAKVGDKNNQTYVLKEGMYVGVDNAKLQAILPGGIILVEKIKNIYDQDEYLETVILVSSD